MADVALLAARRAVLPHTTAGGHTVTVHAGRIYLNARPITPTDALDVCAALGRAVTDIAEQRIPNHEGA